MTYLFVKKKKNSFLWALVFINLWRMFRLKGLMIEKVGGLFFFPHEYHFQCTALRVLHYKGVGRGNKMLWLNSEFVENFKTTGRSHAIQWIFQDSVTNSHITLDQICFITIQSRRKVEWTNEANKEPLKEIKLLKTCVSTISLSKRGCIKRNPLHGIGDQLFSGRMWGGSYSRW